MKHEKQYRSTGKIGKRLKRFRIVPWLELLLALGFLAALIFLLVKYAVPKMRELSERFVSCQQDAPPTPVPTEAPPTPVPTPDPYPNHALYSADLLSLQTEIVIPEYQYATDVTVSNGTICAAVGNYTQDGTAAFVRLMLYTLRTNRYTLLPLPLEYKSIRFPAVSPRWVVYLDSAANGGGRMMAYDLNRKEARILKVVHTGLPKPVLYQNTAFWIERTGETRDKLFAVDLETGESATLAIYDSSPYGLSRPFVYQNTLLYVAPDGKLTKMNIDTGKTETVPVGADYIHDPQMNADGIAFLDSDHRKDGRLLWYDGTETVEVISGAVDFALGNGFIAYSRYDKNYVYYYADRTTFCTTRKDETAMLLGGGEDVIVWMDVHLRDKDIMEFMTVGE
jgi:outer membrane protein assembly factor BamB